MRNAAVYHNGRQAGILIEHGPNSYEFTYHDGWLANDQLPAISLTLPKSQRTHRAPYLFPFFFNMLSEGANRSLQCHFWKLAENDHFGLLLATATVDTIGPVTVGKLDEA